MKTSLEHLPAAKQQQILEIAGIITTVVAPEKIILFGSYATGSWVDDRYTEDGILYEYISDYDFLVVTRESPEKEYVLVDQIVNRCRMYRTAVNPIIHDIAYVNEGLSFGQYFFTDIITEGVLLYDTGMVAFEPPKMVSAKERKAIAQRYFDQWFESASQFLKYADYAFNDAISEKKKLNESAFLLHQAAERFYNTILLVCTGYKPKTHNLDKLRSYAKPLSRELFKIFMKPPGDEQEKHLFSLLMRGYIDARYKSDYSITSEELKELIARVRKMHGVVENVCREKIDTLN